MVTLRKGSKGAEVKELQRLLNLHGAKLTVDGDFGTNTYKAVIEYQKKNSLTPDGIVGPKTWDKLKPTIGKALQNCLNDISTLPSFKTLMELIDNE